MIAGTRLWSRCCRGVHRRWLVVIASIGVAMVAQSGAAASDAAPAVTVKPFAAVKMFPEYSAPGTVLSLNDSRISAQIDGVIERITAKPGDVVAAGTELVQLDCRDHKLNARAPRAQLQSARARQELADYRHKRAAKLRERGVMPLEKFQQRKAAALQAAAEVRRLQAVVREGDRRVAKCSVKAPFPAVVVERYASVGELAAPGTRLLRLVDTGALEVSSQIQAQDVSSVRGARGIEFVSRGRRYPLRLRSVVPVLDRRVSSYEVRFRLTGKSPAPGQSGRIRWHDDRPHVPANLLVQRGNRQGIFVVEDAHARFRALDDAEPGQPAAVALADGERLVVDGRYALTDGQSVRPVDP